MTDPVTPNLGLAQPITGTDSGTWGNVLNNNFGILDDILGATYALALSNANVTLTQSQATNLAFNLTGALTANVTVSFPAIGGLFLVQNNTTGNYTVTVNTTAVGSTGVTIAQGTSALVYLNGTNATTPVAQVPSGTNMLFLQASAPAGWTQVTTYNDATLRIVSGSGGALHGTIGLSAFISGGTGAHTLLLAEIPAHSHGVTDPGHEHIYSAPQQLTTTSGSAGGFVFNQNLYQFNTSAAATNISIQNTGGGGSHNHTLQDLQYLDSIICAKD